MNDRDQARADLIAALERQDESNDPLMLTEDYVTVMLAHPDLVLRALGMKQVDVSGFQDWAWVEPDE